MLARINAERHAMQAPNGQYTVHAACNKGTHIQGYTRTDENWPFFYVQEGCKPPTDYIFNKKQRLQRKWPVLDQRHVTAGWVVQRCNVGDRFGSGGDADPVDRVALARKKARSFAGTRIAE